MDGMGWASMKLTPASSMRVFLVRTIAAVVDSVAQQIGRHATSVETRELVVFARRY